MKKVLFTMLALVLAIGLAIPMAIPAAAAASTTTTYFDTSWEKTSNYSLDATIAATPYPCGDTYWTYTSTVWDGPSTNGYGATIPSWVAGDFWAYWLHHDSPKTNFSHYWFKTTLNICGPRLAADIKLVNKYNHSILSINDDLYVYVNGVYAASGGTAPRVGYGGLPAGFVTASGQDKTLAPETDGWYIAGGLTIPKAAFTAGPNEICILTEDFWDWGGLAHPEFAVTYYDVSLGAVTPTPAYNPVGTDHTVSVNIGNAVADIPVTFVVTGANPTSGVEYTDSTGTATFTYTGNNPGVDTIYAFIDCNGNGSWDEGEPKSSADATKYWLENFVTGGGNYKEGKTVKYTFGGNVGYLPDGTIVGQFEIVDHTGKQAVSWHCHNDFSSLVFSGPPIVGPPGPSASSSIATFVGHFTSNKGGEADLTVVINDVFEPGAGYDTISITGLSSWTLTNPVTISGGNFQVHNVAPVVVY